MPVAETVNNGVNGIVTVDAADTEWAYMAGFVDGEGCISAHPSPKRKHTPRHRRPYLTISQRVEAPLTYIQGIFGGWMKIDSRGKYVWGCGGMRMKAILEGMLPYLVLKRKEAALALHLFHATHEDTIRLAKELRLLKYRNRNLTLEDL